MNTDTFRDRLTDEKATLTAELETIGRKNPSNPNDWEAVPEDIGAESDPTDAADLIEAFETNTAILKDLEIRYNDVVSALERIEEGAYGICEVCNETIEEDRLEADPAARTCITHMR